MKSHLEIVNERYFEHMRHAWGFAGTMFCAAVACFIHGIFPNRFCSTGSEKIKSLNERMSNRSK
jgi:hypothetical protein